MDLQDLAVLVAHWLNCSQPYGVGCVDGREELISSSQYDWLYAKMSEVINAVRIQLPGERTGYCPGGVYTFGVWPRDMYYIVHAVPELVPAVDIKGVCELLIEKQRSDGSVPTYVWVDGVAGYCCWNYFLGYGDVPPQKAIAYGPHITKPEGDSGQFLVILAYEYFDRTRDQNFVSTNLNAMKRAMDVMPRSENGLIWIDPAAPHTPYGFTDNVVKTGNVLYCSLLYWEASKKLQTMAHSVGDSETANDFAARAN